MSELDNYTIDDIVEEIECRTKLLLHAENLNKSDSLNDTIKIIEFEIGYYKDELEKRMNNLSYEYKLKKIIEHFGIDNQVHKLAEEVGELIGAIVRYNGGFLPTNKRIEEEFADVCMLMDQIELFYNIDPFKINETLNTKPDEVIEKYNIKMW